jgi:hypothetical protein
MDAAEIENNDTIQDTQGYFPLEYFVDFLRFLHDHKDIIEIITYDDLAWGDDYDYNSNYNQEYKSWQREIKAGTRDETKIYVLLQHDVDRLPERTLDILKVEAEYSIPSNVMIFHRRISRRHYQKTGELLYTDYELDYTLLRQLQDEAGFVIGYHSNAYDRSLFDVEKALHIFEEDVAALRRYFNIRYFSPHGGLRDPRGQSNNTLPIPPSLSHSIRWVANNKTARFTASYSDGGINSAKRNPEGRDLRDFVKNWKPGHRYRVLTHPQYYHTPCHPSPRLAGTPWYDQLLEFYATGQPDSAWADVSLIEVTGPGELKHQPRSVLADVRQIVRRISNK